MSMISATDVGCSSARNKGTCANRAAIARADIEARVLAALGRRLMDPDLFGVFYEEFTAEMNRLRCAIDDNRAAKERELTRIDRDLERLVQALIDGVTASAVREKMATLEARKAALTRSLDDAPAPKPLLHPSMAQFHRDKVACLADALNAPDMRKEAAETLRGLVHTTVLTPGNDGNSILLKGDLAAILGLASGSGDGKTAAAGGPSAVSQVSLVAGAGFEPATFRL